MIFAVLLYIFTTAKLSLKHGIPKPKSTRGVVSDDTRFFFFCYQHIIRFLFFCGPSSWRRQFSEISPQQLVEPCGPSPRSELLRLRPASPPIAPTIPARPLPSKSRPPCVSHLWKTRRMRPRSPTDRGLPSRVLQTPDIAARTEWGGGGGYC